MLFWHRKQFFAELLLWSWVLCNPGSNASDVHVVADVPASLDVRLLWEPPDALPPDGSAGTCNAYLAALAPLQRLLWVVAFLARNDFVVILVNDIQEDPSFVQDHTAWAQVIGLVPTPCASAPSSRSPCL